MKADNRAIAKVTPADRTPAIAQGVMSSELGAHCSRCSRGADLPAIGFAKSKKEEDRTRRRDATLGGAHVASHAKDRTTTDTSLIGIEGLKSDRAEGKTPNRDRIDRQGMGT